MRLYVYCLSDESAGDAHEWPEGVGGARVRLSAAAACGVRAVVSEFEGERVLVTRENLRAHNRVNAGALARVTPLPFRFGTLADEARLYEYVASNEGALLEAFARVRGCVEMGVKVRLVEGAGVGASESNVEAEDAGVGAKESRVRVEEAGATPEAGATREAGAGGRGTAFLLAKRREILGGENAKARAEEAAARLGACVAGLARESDVRLSPEGPIVVRAAHLVARGDAEEYRVRVRSFGASMRGMQVLASGPWPPYSFGLRRGGPG
jgi:hypothetical protein